MTEQIKSPEAATNGARINHIKAQAHNNETPFQKLSSRLSYCEQSGPDPNQYVARCLGPVHKHGDSDPSLSIYETEDGTLLIHCKSGCRWDEVLAAVGLEAKDLYPDPDPGHRPPIPKGKRWNYKALLQQLHYESMIVLTAALATRDDALTDEDRERVDQAAIRIARVMEATQ